MIKFRNYSDRYERDFEQFKLLLLVMTSISVILVAYFVISEVAN